MKSAKDQAAETQPRTLQIRRNEGIVNEHGSHNAIHTTKYNILTWLPMTFWMQFRRVANIYFILISILMFIGTYATYLFVSPLNPYSTIFTLLVVLLVTSIKEGVEDLARARSDKEENTRIVTEITFAPNGQVMERQKESKEIQSGDIIKLTGTTPVPADMVLILTSNYEDGNQCYVETSNIDGETNLKLREAPAALKALALAGGGSATTALFNGRLEVEPPNKNIHNFIAALHLEDMSEPVPLGPENLLLRSSLFSNTDWAYGIAVYTGQETKIQMNNLHAASKLSNIEVYLNKAIILIFCAQLTLVIMSVASIYILGYQDYGRMPYVFPTGKSDSILPLWLEQFFVFFLLFNNFIPISLYVTIELVNVGQSFMVGCDDQMYDEALNVPCTVRSSNLVQELGQVSNIFSDKTGTLTRNEMKFVKFVVDGQIYDVGEEGVLQKEDIRLSDDSKLDNVSTMRLVNSRSSSSILEESAVMRTISGSNGKKSKIYDFLRCLTTCHTVIRERNGTYRAESPDELALIEGVGMFRCGLKDRGTSSMTVYMLDSDQSYEILAVNAFNSDRKRMSILIRETATGEYYLMCKGADSTVLGLCSTTSAERKAVEKSLLDLANLGLRTLCIAHKKLDARTATEWLASYRAAAASLQDRANQLADAAAAIEQDLTLLGLSAIEDRLQDEVPEVIADLARAGIVLWMLTGDKEETAINIGHSCNLLTSKTKIHFLTKINDPVLYAERLKDIYDDVQLNYVEGEGYRADYTDIEGGGGGGEAGGGAGSGFVPMALVLDGPSLEHFNMEDAEQRQRLLAIGKVCRSVIGCRLTPIQKQQVVHLVKVETVPKATTLSIGDGANDVSMIREADVGVGIFGKEGRQAANNADFAIGQFKFLRRLLLIHGRWNYIRQSKVFLYCMHKNQVITLTLFWYNYFNAVSGTSFYESWVYTGFNFILGLPIIFLGIQDKDLSAEFVCKNPETYSTGRENAYLQIKTILMWIFNGWLYAVTICLLFYYATQMSFMPLSLYEMGTTVFVGTCNALQWKVAYLLHQWTWIQFFLFILSVFGAIAYFCVLAVELYEYWYVAQELYASALFWLIGFFAVPFFVIFVDVIGYNLYYFLLPTKEMLYREVEMQDALSKYEEAPPVGVQYGHGPGDLPVELPE